MLLAIQQKLQKGVPQGSVLNPFRFSIIINDMFYFVKNCNIINLADGSTLSHFDEIILKVFEIEGKLHLTGSFHCTQTNPIQLKKNTSNNL